MSFDPDRMRESWRRATASTAAGADRARRARDPREQYRRGLLTDDELVEAIGVVAFARFVDEETRAAWRPCCKVYDYNREHICVVYDGPPCERDDCDEPTVSGFYGAPGVGRFTECRAGHHVGSVRILEPWETI